MLEATSGNTGIGCSDGGSSPRFYKSNLHDAGVGIKGAPQAHPRLWSRASIDPTAGEGMKGAVAAAEKLGESGAVLVLANLKMRRWALQFTTRQQVLKSGAI